MPRKSGLNATTKAALEKFLAEGKDVSEIAEIMAKPVSTVYRWIRISGLSGLTEGNPWVDAYTGMPITIPDKPERPVECAEWIIIGAEQGLNDDEAFSDPQGLWTLFSYVLDCRDKPVRTPLKVKYLGPIVEGIRYQFDELKLICSDHGLIDTLKDVSLNWSKLSTFEDSCNETVPTGATASAFGLVWIIDKESGKKLFEDIYDQQLRFNVDSNDVNTLDRIHVGIMVIQCLLSHAPDFIEKLPYPEKKQYYENFQKLYASVYSCNIASIISGMNSLLLRFTP